MPEIRRHRSDRIGYAVTKRRPARTQGIGTEVARADAGHLVAGRDALSAIYRAGGS